MRDNYEAVHVHSIDARGVIEEYKKRGFILKERTTPTIVAQGGFVKLIFAKAEEVEVKKNGSAYLG